MWVVTYCGKHGECFEQEFEQEIDALKYMESLGSSIGSMSLAFVYDEGAGREN